jgi:ribosome-associated heat shock protein Hsp15
MARIDKYLWAIRLFKTRSMAITAIGGGKVKFEGVNVKPAKDVKIGETYTVQQEHVLRTIKVVALLERRVSAKEVSAFVEDLTPSEAYNNVDRMKNTRFVFRPRGIGRPTKKDRRDIDEWFDDGKETKQPV